MDTWTGPDAAHLPPVSNESRGEAIRRRREALGITGHRQFARATGRARETLVAAEEGTASDATMDWLETWLAREEAEAGMTDEPPAGEPLRIEMHGVYGIEEVIVTGPVDRPDELAEAVARILERLRSQSQ